MVEGLTDGPGRRSMDMFFGGPEGTGDADMGIITTKGSFMRKKQIPIFLFNKQATVGLAGSGLRR